MLGLAGETSRTLTSAWIETQLKACVILWLSVALSRVRGLKLLKEEEDLVKERRTLTSAWIETRQKPCLN